MKRYSTDEIYREWLKIKEWENAPSILSRRMHISLNTSKGLIKRFFFDPSKLMEELNPPTEKRIERRYK